MTSAVPPAKQGGSQVTLADADAQTEAGVRSPTDTTPLLGAGASDNDLSSSGLATASDFSHLPWWRRPSVRSASLPQPAARAFGPSSSLTACTLRNAMPSY